eukprot:3279955-Pyramimonas_sp.AAC.1
MRGRIQRLNTLLGLGRRLQRYISTHLHDHVPVLMEFDIKPQEVFHGKYTPAVNRDTMMAAYTSGRGRLEYLRALEQEATDIPEEQWREIWDRGDVQAAWNKLSESIRKAMQQVFPAKKQDIVDYEGHRKRRMELLRLRGRLRDQLHATGLKSFTGNGSTAFDEIEDELRRLSRRMQTLRKEQKKEKMETLAAEIFKAWKQGRHAEVHRLRVQLAGRGRGPKKRLLFAPRQSMTLSEWKD